LDFTKEISYKKYELKFIAIWLLLFLYSLLVAIQGDLFSFSGSAQKNSSLHYVHRTIDVLFRAFIPHISDSTVAQLGISKDLYKSKEV
jgi:hypothetical protein